MTLAGALSGALKDSPVLQFSNTDIGVVGSAYLAGAVVGALFFGWLTDRLGRKKLFFVTLAVYLIATGATALTWNLWTFALCRFFTGAGIGGEYAAINSTIQELVPARVRGATDLVINGSFWVGAAMGAVGSVVLLDPTGDRSGNRLAARIPDRRDTRPDRLFHADVAAGKSTLADDAWPRRGGGTRSSTISSGGITGRLRPTRNLPRVRLRSRSSYATRRSGACPVRACIAAVPRSAWSLMAAQAFFYNAIFFTYALVLTDFFAIPSDRVGLYILPFAAGNFLGPVLLGRLFDTRGRRPMIFFTYLVSGLLLALTGFLFMQGILTAFTQTLCWMAIFFFASAAASSAYLTVSETFPLETRALAIAIFYAIGTGIGGVAGPWIFGALIDTGSRPALFAGYLFAAALMIGAAFVALRFAVAAEGKPLEQVAKPLASWD